MRNCTGTIEYVVKETAPRRGLMRILILLAFDRLQTTFAVPTHVHSTTTRDDALFRNHASPAP